MDIVSAEIAYAALHKLTQSSVEEFWVLALGPQKTLLRSKMIFRGTVDRCMVHPRDIFRFACVENASSIIVAHNHPSGDPTPSEEDLLFTRRLLRAADVLEIPIDDHLIVAATRFSSLMGGGWIARRDASAIHRVRLTARRRFRHPTPPVSQMNLPSDELREDAHCHQRRR